MRIIYFGSSGPLSALPLQALLDAGCNVCAVVVDARHLLADANLKLPVLVENSDSIVSLAALHDIPVIGWSKSATANLTALRLYQPELVLTSCFSHRLPDALLGLPGLGCFNLHPSKLPANRGPQPVFWQFRDGVTDFTVTLHRMSRRFDAGPIVAQAGVPMPNGVDGYQADTVLGHAAARLLMARLDDIAHGAAQEVPQDESIATYRGVPAQRDFAVSPAWSARRLYNFICATRDRGFVYPCEIDGSLYPLVLAESYQPAGTGRLLVRGTEILIPCNPGVVRARLQRNLS